MIVDSNTQENVQTVIVQLVLQGFNQTHLA